MDNVNSLEYEIFKVFPLFLHFRVLLRNARKLAQNYYLAYQENIPTAQIVHRIANVMQEYTQSGYVYRKTKKQTNRLQFMKYPL